MAELERVVQIRAAQALITAGQGRGDLELPQPQGNLRLFVQLPDAFQKGPLARFAAATAQAGLRVAVLGFLHVEAHVVEAMPLDERNNGVGVIAAIVVEHGDPVAGEAIAIEGFVEKSGAIKADAFGDVVGQEAVAPALIDQGAVGLQVCWILRGPPRWRASAARMRAVACS